MTDELGSDRGEDATTPLRVELTTLSDVGSVRNENQDFVTSSVDQDEAAGRGQILVVADGMGGHQGGATASRMSATTVKSQYLRARTEDVATGLREALLAANRQIHAAASSDQHLEGMGTTTSAMVFRDSSIYIAHVGDSRVYRVRNGEIEQLTEDHSLVATMVKQGLITPEEAESHPRRNVLQRSMGVSEEVEVDILGPEPLELGDVYLSCSDGLHGQMTEEEILEIIEKGGDLTGVAKELVELALERGAPDNVTVGLARVIEGGPAVPYDESYEPEEEPVEIPRAIDTTPEEAHDADEPLPTVERPIPRATPAGCLLQLLLLILLAFAVGGALLMLLDEQRIVSLFAG